MPAAQNNPHLIHFQKANPLKELTHYRGRLFAKTVIEGKITLEVTNLICVRLLSEALRAFISFLYTFGTFSMQIVLFFIHISLIFIGNVGKFRVFDRNFRARINEGYVVSEKITLQQKTPEIAFSDRYQKSVKI